MIFKVTAICLIMNQCQTKMLIVSEINLFFDKFTSYLDSKKSSITFLFLIYDNDRDKTIYNLVC